MKTSKKGIELAQPDYIRQGLLSNIASLKASCINSVDLLPKFDRLQSLTTAASDDNSMIPLQKLLRLGNDFRNNWMLYYQHHTAFYGTTMEREETGLGENL
ncbi:hypothetical protein CHS0354_041438 [Potamilus streckersoni]|uniref:Uncharacterized protein n=1 Tax=Potamilus streckersoni TaxID=2493646 RepID=A0AAE0T9W9_9BIVA|nr:hypothetical protein CHS0354_041438 [Potamilus streckersoni]